MAKSGIVRISRDQSLWLCAGLVSVIIPAWDRLPGWIWGFVILAVVWFWQSHFGNWFAAGKWSRLGLTILMVTLIFVKYGTILGKDPGVVLLAGMLALKLLELRRRRDVLLTIFLSYFLLTTNFLFSQSIALAVYLLICLYAITVSLIKVSVPDALPQSRHYGVKLGWQILLYSLPLAVILFFLFPRLSGPLWGLQTESTVASTGLSDSIRPGSIASMIRNNDIAFRAMFVGEPPVQENLYWRGLVLSHYDGEAWTMGDYRRLIASVDATDAGTYDYRIILEPTQQRWLFALDRPLQTAYSARLTANLEMLTDKPILQTISYKMRSAPGLLVQNHSGSELENNLQLPAQRNGRTRALVQSWLDTGMSKEEIAGKALDYFSGQPFYYSLNAPLLGLDAVDDFLFQTRKGFCEHYASSYSVMMRMAGIPARVVIGYQGGERNPLGRYLIIRQSDAHAWVEIWLQDQGWVRIDPTAAVAPERIERGIEASVPQEDIRAGLFRTPAFLVRHLSLYWDGLNTYWHNWIVNYDAKKQMSTLQSMHLGIQDMKDVVMVLALVATAVIGIVALIIILPRRKLAADPALRLYGRFCQKLEKLGVKRLPTEAPFDFCQRVTTHYPHLQQQVQDITELYVSLRYAPPATAASLAGLRQRVQAFQPRKGQ